MLQPCCMCNRRTPELQLSAIVERKDFNSVKELHDVDIIAVLRENIKERDPSVYSTAIHPTSESTQMKLAIVEDLQQEN